MRYAYVKYGNVIEELALVGTDPAEVSESGPTTFVENFLKIVGEDPALLISYGFRTESAEVSNVKAQTHKKPAGLFKLFSTMLTGAKIATNLLNFKPDVVICVHDGVGLWSSFIACKLTSTPLVHSRQRAISGKRDRWYKQMATVLDRYVLRRATTVICHGPFTRSQLLAIGVSDADIIEYDVSFAQAMLDHRKDPNHNIESTSAKVFFLGRVEASKGVFDLLDACTPIMRERPGVELVYVGGGDALDTLKTRVAQSGLDSRIHLTGRVSHSEIGQHLKSATVMVTPTRFGLEGWGMAALEGLAMGVPVIAPNAGSFPFMLQDGANGLLYESDSIEDLRRKIEQLLDSPELQRKLSVGALASEQARSNSLVKFGDALKLATRHPVDPA